MKLARSAVWLSLIALSAEASAQDGRQHVAVVIGIGAYAKLPSDIGLNFARSNAATLAQALKEKARYDQVFLLADTQATKAGIEAAFKNQVAPLVGPNDVLFVYFEGHGIGSDLGQPTFLAYDSSLEGEEALPVADFAADLNAWVRPGTLMVVTDAIHSQQYVGFSFFGPAATHWPRMPRGTAIISSTQPETPAADGAFGKVLIEAMSGAADTDRNGEITSSELYLFLVNELSPGQVPASAGDLGTNEIARGVTNPRPDPAAPSDGTITVSGTNGALTPAPPPEVLYPDVEIASAKFVFQEGASQSVQCRETPIKACAPSCYVRYFRAGPCEVNALIDGTSMKGQVIVLSKGKYDCRRKAGDLVCDGPYL